MKHAYVKILLNRTRNEAGMCCYWITELQYSGILPVNQLPAIAENMRSLVFLSENRLTVRTSGSDYITLYRFAQLTITEFDVLNSVLAAAVANATKCLSAPVWEGVVALECGMPDYSL